MPVFVFFRAKGAQHENKKFTLYPSHTCLQPMYALQYTKIVVKIVPKYTGVRSTSEW